MKKKIVSKILISLKSKFVLIFLLLSVIPLLFSFFFAVNVLIEIVELTFSRNLAKISSEYYDELTNNAKAKLIFETLNADDELKIKLFLNMSNQVAGKIKLIFEENNISAIGIINNSATVKSYFYKDNQYKEAVERRLLEFCRSKQKTSGVSRTGDLFYSFYGASITDKDSNHSLGY
ncbi:MAG TPA: hypothetical protein PLQ81_08145, partial [bacterium]|nr:hypothetical protein [bacterium]